MFSFEVHIQDSKEVVKNKVFKDIPSFFYLPEKYEFDRKSHEEEEDYIENAVRTCENKQKLSVSMKRKSNSYLASRKKDEYFKFTVFLDVEFKNC